MNRFKQAFDNWPILDGREYIEADLGTGVTVRAYVELDQFARPDESWATAEDIKAFNEDRLRFCELALNVYVGGACIETDAANLCSIGIVEDDETSGEYLTERANELLNQIDLPGIVGGFAKQATAAARKLRKGVRA
jgi:hypothetical protein